MPIIGHSCYSPGGEIMRFRDREEAGRRLAEALAGYANKDVVVYALPRGGVVLGYEIARSLHVPLDLVITRKIGYPGNEEYAVCAVAEDGDMICDSVTASQLDREWLKSQAEKQMQEAARRRQAYLQGREMLPAAGKVAIIVDDGVATGLTILLAIIEVGHQGPEKIVVAVPVSSASAAERIREEADEFIALQIPTSFMAVGEFYEQFPQLDDDEVIRLMKQAQGLR
jgi:putative phosphoribosyl transferase